MSWNFKHIVNFGRITKFNGVNSIEGYWPIEIQKALMKEYEERKGEFKSFADFLNAKSEESLWQRAFRDRVAKARSKASA